MESRPHLNSKYLGLHSCRYQTTFVSSPFVYFSKGSYVSKMNIHDLEETFSFQAHNGMISAINPRPRINPTSIFTIDYYGDIALHTLTGECLNRLSHSPKQIVPKCVRTSATNSDGTLLAIVSTGGNSYNGLVEIFSINSLNEITKVRVLRGNFKQCEFANDLDLFVLRENIVSTEIENPWRQKDLPLNAEKILNDFDSEKEEIESSEDLLESMTVHSKRIVNYYACVFYDIATQRVGKAEELDIYSRVNCMRQNYQGKVVFATMKRTVYVMEMQSLSMLHVLSLVGAGSLAMVICENDYLYFSPQANYFCRFNMARSKVNQEIDIKNTYPELEILKTDQKWIHKNNYLAWGESEKTIISLNEYGIFSADFQDFPNNSKLINCKHKSLFKITCCGLDIHASQKLVAIGDFNGGVFIFDYELNTLVCKSKIFGCIRCLCFHYDTLYIGTIEGNIFAWDFFNSEQQELFFSIGDQESVICMAWKSDSLAVGSRNGEIWLFPHTPSEFHKFLAHETQESDERFGSLGLFSEVWSITWSPCGNFLASASEDQSVRIWNTHTYAIAAVLPKHKRAVTGVRWEKIENTLIGTSEVSEILVSCSDDETLRVYNTSTWEILLTVCTSCIQEWHTITYAAIEKNGRRVACVTQNGFLFVVDLRNGNFEVVERLHNGSIEGFDWKTDLITCSSEGLACVVSL